jgi:hypothetical protein
MPANCRTEGVLPDMWTVRLPGALIQRM